MTAAARPDTLPVAQVRIVRPTDKLSEVVTFYRDLLGLKELYRFEDYGGFDGVMLGLPGASHHLEFTTHVDGSPCPAPTNSNLLVFYFGTGAAIVVQPRREPTRHRCSRGAGHQRSRPGRRRRSHHTPMRVVSPADATGP
jgi:catechol 2,3-dioxygenase-like lactoylglutathione lyase family enzyme